jgi:hypothetical protein
VTVTVSDAGCGNNDSEDLCDNITIEANDTGIVVGGLNSAAVSSVQVFDASWQTEFSCFGDCAATTTVPVTAGTYLVYVKLYTSGYSLICEINETVVVTAGGGGGTTCDNVTSGGTIGGTQTICPNESAATLTSVSLPSGGSGNVEYLWLSSTTGCPTSLNQEISGANQATYNPGVLTQTTYFVRCSRRSGCTSWEFGESNCVTVTVSDADCGGGTGNSNGIDLTVTISGDGAEVSPYTDFSVDLTVTNEGTQNATNVVVNIPQPENVVFQGGNGFSATQGDYDLFSTFNWNLGSIAAGQTATITLNYYALAGAPYTVYGQVQSMTGTDVDSTPGNGTPPNPNEDDEAIYVTGSGGTTGTGGGTGGTPACTLNLAAAVSNIVCNDNGTPANAADDTFTFDVLVTGGNPWGWTGGGQSGDYAQVASYGPYDISAGNINFTIVDNDNATCTTNVSVTAPSTCSNDGTNGGGTTPTNDCSDISVGESGGDIVISGLDNAPLTGVWVFDINWNTVFDCSYGCGAMETIDVNPGTYHVIVKKLNTDWSVICEINETVIISAFIFQNIGNLDSPTQVGEEDADYRNDNTSVEKTEVAFGVYPNPASNFINITLDDETTGTINLSLTDKFGRRIYQQNNNADDMRAIKLDLSNYAAGVYFLTLQSEDSLPVTKQIVLLK